jgi:hypothetical protein
MIVLLIAIACCSSVFGAFVNDGKYVDTDWSGADPFSVYMDKLDGSSTDRIGFALITGTGGTAPAVTGDILTCTMEGASASYSMLFNNVALDTYVFNAATNYTVTTRLMIDQFPDCDFSETSANEVGITLMDVRGIDRLLLHLEPDALWVNHSNGNWTNIPVTTAEDTWYTWQFEVSQDPTATAGTLDIYRRALDSDPWSVVATGVLLREENITDQIASLFRVEYNADNTKTQGILKSDYLQLGQEYVPPEAKVNDAGFANMNWNDPEPSTFWMEKLDASSTNLLRFYWPAGTDGDVPAADNGLLTVSMTGATGGHSYLFTDALDTYVFHEATNYIVTTRLMVDQFPDCDFSETSANGVGVTLMDLRGIDRLIVHLEPDGLWVNHNNNDWELVASITTAEDVWYTWQFELSQDSGATGGELRIFRRESDQDSWTLVATDITARNQNVADQFIMYDVYYNADNTQTQGILVSDYLHIGEEGDAPNPEIGTISTGLLSGTNALAVSWNSDTWGTGTYVLQRSPTLTPAPAWSNVLENISGGSVCVTVAVDQVQSFYRVVAE